MALVKTKPTSAGRRSMVKVVNADLHKGSPYAPLVEALTVDAPKTKVLAGKLRAMGLADVLILTDKVDENLFLSSRNLPGVLVLEARHADPVSLVHAAQVVITKGAVKHLEEALA